MGTYWWIVPGIVLVIAVAALSRVFLAKRKVNRLQRAQREFRQRREWLEARFFSLAAASGKPRGLAWTNCDFATPVSFASDPKSGQLRAFVAVAVSFEAIEGGGMEEVEAVGNIRAATAVFEFDDKQWGTQGRVIFNLEPQEAIMHFHHRPLIAD